MGNIITVEYKSNVLKENPLKDPYKRDIYIYLPDSYYRTTKRYPVVYLLSGFTGYGALNMNLSPYSENIKERLNRLIKTRKIREMIVVMPDCFTKYGGSQYVNSSATGRYEDYVIREIVSFVDKGFRTIPEPDFRCIMGKSSGGFGAMWLGMRHPDVFGLMASHSGDSAFEYCYMKDFPDFIIQIQNYGEAHQAVRNFIRTQINKKQPKPRDFHNILNIIGMSACYSPNPNGKFYNFDLPFDIYSAEIIPEIWNKWLRFDPIRLVDKYKDNLKKLKLIFADCGIRDEFHLQAGTRIFCSKLKKYGINFIHEEFNDGHMNIQYRYDTSLQVISEHFAK
ncbi:MAG: esterase family protein [Ignavibacteria bacterium]|nr:esterase family protein [Ignavibacteria bacterium]